MGLALLTTVLSIHNRGMVGHVEEVVVSKDHRAKSLGLKVIQALDSIAVRLGCRKTILNCAEHNVGFYAKGGYERSGIEMSHHHGPST